MKGLADLRLLRPGRTAALATALALSLLAGCAGNRLAGVADAYRDRGEARLSAGEDLDGAVSDLTHAIRYSPEDANLYASRGIAYLKKGDVAKARADFEQASSRDTALGEALLPLLSPASSWSPVGSFPWGDFYAKDDSVERSADGRYLTVFVRTGWDVTYLEIDCSDRKWRLAGIYNTPYFGWDNVTEGTVIGLTAGRYCR